VICEVEGIVHVVIESRLISFGLFAKPMLLPGGPSSARSI
jgi:hypothetical protein